MTKSYMTRVSMVFKLPNPIEGEGTIQAEEKVAEMICAMDDYELLSLLNGAEIHVELADAKKHRQNHN